MRTILFLVAGLFLMASLLIVAKMFSEHFPSAPNWAVALGLKSVADDHCHQHVDRGFKGRLLGGRRIAHIAPLFAVPAAVVALVRWRFL